MMNSTHSSSDNEDDIFVEEIPKILWSCVARNHTILAEAAAAEASVHDQPDVAKTAQGLLQRKPTPGFEFHKRGKLKGVKFHVYEHVSPDDDDNNNNNTLIDISSSKPELRLWEFAAVYDPAQIEKSDVQQFLEKMVTITETPRQDDEEWKTAGLLGLQTTFAPILKQRMDDVTYLGKMALLDEQIQACQLQMEQNIHNLMENQEKIEDLNEDANRMQEMASVFKKRAKKVRRYQMMKNAKYGIVMGTAVTAATAAIVIPPLVAIL